MGLGTRIGIGRPGRHTESEAVGAAERERRSDLWHADSRRLRNGLISLAIFFGLLAALLTGVPGLKAAARRIEHANPTWIAIGVGCEVLSCLSYVLLFGRVFARLRGRAATLLSLSELAMNSVVSAGGLGGFALGAWVLRNAGASLRRIAERSLVMFLITSAVNVGAVAVLGFLMGFGLIGGTTNPLLTLLPAAAAVLAFAGTVGVGVWARRLLDRPRAEGRLGTALCAISEGVFDTLDLLLSFDLRAAGGALGYWLFDNLVLLFAFYAYGLHPNLAVVGLGYLIGMLANSLPIPGGFGAVEGGLVGMLIAYGLHPASLVVAAVLSYRAIALWVPSVIGTVAFWELRGELSKELLRPQPSQATG